eukprot:15452784-Alexandrium_andersonii.AAC.1
MVGPPLQTAHQAAQPLQLGRLDRSQELSVILVFPPKKQEVHVGVGLEESLFEHADRRNRSAMNISGIPYME